MKMITEYTFIIKAVLFILLLGSCEEFFDPPQELIVETDHFYRDWSEYRAAEMGLYALQQDLVEQIVILGDLRADLMEITPNADRDLVEVYNFQITRNNIYASPTNFYKIIGACNRLIRQLESDHPEVLDKTLEATVYDQLYGEALCMRAWAYFNTVRIFKEIPYIWPSLTSITEIRDYVNSSQEFIDSIDIEYSPGGYYNDTIRNEHILLNKMYLDMSAIIDTFTYQLENKIKAVGVNHYMTNNDLTWDAIVWNQYSMHCLLGQMYLYDGNYAKARAHFSPIMYNYTSETSDIRFGLDSRFKGAKWKNIFSGIDIYEHIHTIWFGKSYLQTHKLQNFFSVIPPNSYMLKPTAIAIHNWETIWDGMIVRKIANNPKAASTFRTGLPGDFHRGYGLSYAYMKNGAIMEKEDVRKMLSYKQRNLLNDMYELMSDVDTVIYKFTYGKSSNDHDAYLPIFRAGAIHLYFAEIYARWEWDHAGVIIPEVPQSLNILNDGSYNQNNDQFGVRGRVGFGEGDDKITVGNIVYKYDPFTNQVIGYYDFTGNTLAKQEYVEDQILKERARELAFEGERFYDLIRIAKRRNDPSYLADRVAAKFSGAKAEQIKQYLMDENNWYVPLY